jgi:hypothetical protein
MWLKKYYHNAQTLSTHKSLKGIMAETGGKEKINRIDIFKKLLNQQSPKMKQFVIDFNKLNETEKKMFNKIQRILKN